MPNNSYIGGGWVVHQTQAASAPPEVLHFPEMVASGMAENEKVNHWQLLAAELGAEVPEEEEGTAKAEDLPAQETASPPYADAAPGPSSRPTVAASLPPRPAPPRRPAGDWGLLAQELGVEVPPELEAPEPPREKPVPASTVVEHDTRDAAAEPAFGRASGRHAEEDESDESPRSAGRPARDEERRGRKRRRRRRPSGGLDQETAEATVESPATRDWGLPATDEEEPEELDTETVEPASAESESAPSASGEREEGARRGKRRRRRRGGSSRRESSAGDDARRGDSPPSRRSDHEEPEPATPEEDDFEDDLLDEELPAEAGARGEKSIHRAIPSWFDAVNVVISANLESRAKTPDRRSGNRSRGGHDRRGRERSGDRPS